MKPKVPAAESGSSTLASVLRTLLTPFRHLAVRGRRGNWPRSAAILLLKQFASRPKLLAGLGVVRPVDQPELTFNASDSMVLRAVYWFGVQGYEGVLAKLWERLSAKSAAILEIGGNVGLYSVLGGRHSSGSYTVLEPIPAVAEQIRANLRANGIGRVDVVQAAAVPMLAEQTVQMSVPDEGSAMPVGAHLVDGTEVSGRTSGQVLTVKGLPFATLAEGKDLIKIDAEGVEAVLLQAAVGVIARSRPTLVVEVLPESERLGQLLQQLAIDVGYRVYVIPAYGSDVPVEVPAASFHSRSPAAHQSKDVILTNFDLIEMLK